MKIRVIAIAVIARPSDGALLVYDGYDTVRQLHYHRPLGGGFEFGESAEEAVRRELREELGGELATVTLLGYLENRFTVDGRAGHQLVAVFAATLEDPSLYARDEFTFVDNEVAMTARWVLRAGFRSEQNPDGPPLFPVGLEALLDRRTDQDRFLTELAAAKAIRTSARAIIIHDGRVLVQQPADDATACYAFIGGRIEFGELLEARLRKELDEELGAVAASMRYLFVVENRFPHDGATIHLHEHFFLVELETTEIRSREAGLIQTWLPLDRLADFDVRPHVVRDAIVRGEHMTVRHLITT